jgi:hypothetical protein
MNPLPHLNQLGARNSLCLSNVKKGRPWRPLVQPNPQQNVASFAAVACNLNQIYVASFVAVACILNQIYVAPLAAVA